MEDEGRVRGWGWREEGGVVWTPTEHICATWMAKGHEEGSGGGGQPPYLADELVEQLSLSSSFKRLNCVC